MGAWIDESAASLSRSIASRGLSVSTVQRDVRGASKTCRLRVSCHGADLADVFLAERRYGRRPTYDVFVDFTYPAPSTRRVSMVLDVSHTMRLSRHSLFRKPSLRRFGSIAAKRLAAVSLEVGLHVVRSVIDS